MRYSREEGKRTWDKRKRSVNLRLSKTKGKLIQLRKDIITT